MSQSRIFTSENNQSLRAGAMVLVSSLLIGLCSNVSFPLPFTPIPITIQNSLILLFAVLLGSRRSAGAVFCFLVQGAMGLPVFAGAAGGFQIFFGPRGGYLIGYLVAAFLTGWIAERLSRKTLVTAFVALLSGNAVIYLFGAGYLSAFVGIKQAFFLGVLPFLAGDFLKMIIALKVIQWIGWNKSSCR